MSGDQVQANTMDASSTSPPDLSRTHDDDELANPTIDEQRQREESLLAKEETVKESNEGNQEQMTFANGEKTNGDSMMTKMTTNPNGVPPGASGKPMTKKVSSDGGSENDDDDDDDDNAKGEEDASDEEEQLFVQMEEEVEKEEAIHPLEQPTDVKAAPKLLQTAFEKGEVRADDSESDNEEKKKIEETKQEEAEQPHDHHYHARVSKVNRDRFVVVKIYSC